MELWVKNAKVLHLKDKLNDKLKNVHFSEEPGPHIIQLIFGDFRKKHLDVFRGNLQERLDEIILVSEEFSGRVFELE